MSNIKCTNIINCGSCDSCDSCSSCRSCYVCRSCSSCDSCGFCCSCSSCSSCRSCYSCYSCEAVIRGFFCYKQEAKKDIIFRTQVTEDRFWEVVSKYRDLCGDWRPKQTNGGCYESWKDMPQKAIDYVKSLPEFNAEDFKAITGLDANEVVEEMTMDELCKELGRTIKIKK